jgi:hypothetical protein
VPCSTLGLVLQVEDINSTEQYLLQQGIPYERLGNEMSDRELQVLDPSFSQAVDIRLSANPNPNPNLFWREGAAAVLEGTITSIQNSRVLAGKEVEEEKESGRADIDPRILKESDCWMEVKTMAKEGKSAINQ